MLALYYSLAVHMRTALGRWPDSIGERGFPPSLITHAHVAQLYFIVLIWFVMFVFPLEVLISAAHPKLRQFLFFLAVSVAWFVICCVMMLAVPLGFLSWWLD